MAANGCNHRFATLFNFVEAPLEFQYCFAGAFPLIGSFAAEQRSGLRKIGTGRKAFAFSLDDHRTDGSILIEFV